MVRQRNVQDFVVADRVEEHHITLYDNCTSDSKPPTRLKYLQSESFYSCGSLCIIKRLEGRLRTTFQNETAAVRRRVFFLVSAVLGDFSKP